MGGTYPTPNPTYLHYANTAPTYEHNTRADLRIFRHIAGGVPPITTALPPATAPSLATTYPARQLLLPLHVATRKTIYFAHRSALTSFRVVQRCHRSA